MKRQILVFLSAAFLALIALRLALAQYVPASDARKENTAPSLIWNDKQHDAVTAQTPPRSRYKTLLSTLAVPDDQAQYGDFCDFGFWAGTSYGGHHNLQPGYWVYLAPNWYIYKEEIGGGMAAPGAARQWGPEQATGAPDTWPNAGDLNTAWASQTQDGQREWLELTYDAPIQPTAVLIYETFNPGAVDRITAYDAAGKEVEIWAGVDPTAAGSEKGISVIALHPAFDVTRIRIYLDSPKVKGWNEIDAVGLLDTAGTTHWAKSATASSTYADELTNPAQGAIDNFRLGLHGDIHVR